jgi:hypothetical protein
MVFSVHLSGGCKKIAEIFFVTSGFLKEFSRSQTAFSDFSIKMPSEEDF